MKRSIGLYKKISCHIYKKVLKEAQKRENDSYIENVTNKTKKIWQLISKQVGKCPFLDKKIELKTETGIATHPQKWQRC